MLLSLQREHIELLDSHDIGWGQRIGAQCWRVEHDTEGRAWLHLPEAGRDTWRFTRGDNGLWLGAAEGESPGSATLKFVSPVGEAERATRAALVAQRRFRFVREDGGEWPIELLPDGAIGRGVTSTEAGWDVADEGEDGVSLLLHAREAVMVRLRPTDGGAFEGVRSFRRALGESFASLAWRSTAYSFWMREGTVLPRASPAW